MLSLARENASAKAFSDADWTMSTAMGSATVTKVHSKTSPNSGKRQRPSSIGTFRPPNVAALSSKTEVCRKRISRAKIICGDDQHRDRRHCRRAEVIERSELGQDLDWVHRVTQKGWNTDFSKREKKDQHSRKQNRRSNQWQSDAP